MDDILKRLADSSPNESSHELQCRCFDAAEEISRLRSGMLQVRDFLQMCADDAKQACLKDREINGNWAAEAERLLKLMTPNV